MDKFNLQTLYYSYNRDGNIADGADVIVCARMIDELQLEEAVDYAMDLDTLVREDIISAMAKDGFCAIKDGVVYVKN